MIQYAAELGLVGNLISIVCRFIFHPQEEIAFNLFSKMKDQKTLKNEDEKESEKEKPDEIIQTLVKYLSGMLGVGVCAIMFS